jgi:predicted metalloprotease
VLGYDMIQKRATGTVVLDSFTHGSGCYLYSAPREMRLQRRWQDS